MSQSAENQSAIIENENNSNIVMESQAAMTGDGESVNVEDMSEAGLGTPTQDEAEESMDMEEDVRGGVDQGGDGSAEGGGVAAELISDAGDAGQHAAMMDSRAEDVAAGMGAAGDAPIELQDAPEPQSPPSEEVEKHGEPAEAMEVEEIEPEQAEAVGESESENEQVYVPESVETAQDADAPQETAEDDILEEGPLAPADAEKEGADRSVLDNQGEAEMVPDNDAAELENEAAPDHEEAEADLVAAEDAENTDAQEVYQDQESEAEQDSEALAQTQAGVEAAMSADDEDILLAEDNSQSQEAAEDGNDRAPEATEEQVESAADSPEVIEEDEAEVIADSPEVTEDQPDVADASNVSEERTEVDADAPEGSEDRPEVLSDAPEGTEDRPEVLSDAPEVTEDQPEVIEDLPEAAEETPEVIDDAPEVIEDAPEIVSDASETMDEVRTIPEAVEDASEGVDDAPEVVENNLENREDLSAAVHDTPEVIEDSPKAADDEDEDEAPEVGDIEGEPEQSSDQPTADLAVDAQESTSEAAEKEVSADTKEAEDDDDVSIVETPEKHTDQVEGVDSAEAQDTEKLAGYAAAEDAESTPTSDSEKPNEDGSAQALDAEADRASDATIEEGRDIDDEPMLQVTDVKSGAEAEGEPTERLDIEDLTADDSIKDSADAPEAMETETKGEPGKVEQSKSADKEVVDLGADVVEKLKSSKTDDPSVKAPPPDDDDDDVVVLDDDEEIAPQVKKETAEKELFNSNNDMGIQIESVSGGADELHELAEQQPVKQVGANCVVFVMTHLRTRLTSTRCC